MCVDPKDQLILELYVKDLRQSIDFYTKLGFIVKRREEAFAELQWEESRIYLEENSKARFY
jgi:catechol 2,3-dioxygenase-like lactoylglutathione lyase family enzyme